MPVSGQVANTRLVLPGSHRRVDVYILRTVVDNRPDLFLKPVSLVPSIPTPFYLGKPVPDFKTKKKKRTARTDRGKNMVANDGMNFQTRLLH